MSGGLAGGSDMAGHGASHGDCAGCALGHRLGRRGFFGLVGLGILSAVGGFEAGIRIGRGPESGALGHGATPASGATARGHSTGGSVATDFLRPGMTPPPAGAARAKVALDDIPPPRPGPPTTFFRAPSPTQQIALTIDDGFCAPCAEAYVAFAQHTGLPVTFSPNGVYSGVWDPMADGLQSLIATGQVQIGNHTWSHANLLTLSDGAVETELERNDEWIQQRFGITSRPWFRPPYGLHDTRTDDIAGQLGFTHVLMWDGTFGDSTPISPAELLTLARQYLKPGTIMLGHANHTTIVPLLPQVYEMIVERGLVPVTLDEMFGTSRNTG